MSDIQERGKEVTVGRRILREKVELKHYFVNGDVASTFHTDIADNCYARKMKDRKDTVEVEGKVYTMSELVEAFGKDVFVYQTPDGIVEVAKSRMVAAKKYGYTGNGHTASYLNRKGFKNIDGSRIQG